MALEEAVAEGRRQIPEVVEAAVAADLPGIQVLVVVGGGVHHRSQAYWGTLEVAVEVGGVEGRQSLACRQSLGVEAGVEEARRLRTQV